MKRYVRLIKDLLCLYYVQCLLKKNNNIDKKEKETEILKRRQIDMDRKKLEKIKY